VSTVECFVIAINKKDFRGHYGLGQAYEILKMPHMAMYFYKSAHTLRYTVCMLNVILVLEDNAYCSEISSYPERHAH